MTPEIQLAELKTLYEKLQENYAVVLKQRDQYLSDLIATQSQIKQIKTYILAQQPQEQTLTTKHDQAINRIKELYALGADVTNPNAECKNGLTIYRAIHDLTNDEFIELKLHLQQNERCKHALLVRKAIAEYNQTKTNNTLAHDDD